jgi:DNA-binding MarR family transcriptional regulator
LRPRLTGAARIQTSSDFSLVFSRQSGPHFPLLWFLGGRTIRGFTVLIKIEMNLFAGLRRMRELERKHLPFVRSLAEFDIIIEIGFHEERGKPLTLKHLLTLGICARTTLRRKLNDLVEQGVVVRTRRENDGRASLLGISKSAFQRLDRYRGGMLASLGQVA